MNQHIIFDRTRYTDKLRDNGVDEKTARAHSDALDGALRDAVATKADVNEVKAELKGDIAELRADLKGDIAEVRAELHELEGRINLHFVRIDSKIADIDVRFADQNTRFEAAKLEMLRWMIGTQVTMAGIIIGALKFMK